MNFFTDNADNFLCFGQVVKVNRKDNVINVAVNVAYALNNHIDGNIIVGERLEKFVRDARIIRDADN